MNENLMKEFTWEEMKSALDSIGDPKAPGPDGIWIVLGTSRPPGPRGQISVTKSMCPTDPLPCYLDSIGEWDKGLGDRYLLGRRCSHHFSSAGT